LISKFDDRVRRRAHALWEEAGRPLGRNAEIWDLAHQEMTQAVANPVTPARATSTVRKPEEVSGDPN
jgi:hypothetical protein